MIAPPSAGPTARLRLTPALLADTAGASSALGTNWGTTACHAGVFIAVAEPIKTASSSKLKGVMKCIQTSIASTMENTATASSPMIRDFRRSTISASAPAGSANTHIGKLAATCTSATSKGEGSRLVISQPDAALYIQ